MVGLADRRNGVVNAGVLLERCWPRPWDVSLETGDASAISRYLRFWNRSGDTEETMVRRSIAERLAQLEAQRKSLQTKLGKQERAKDTRRKILLGALVLHRLEKGQDAFSKDQLPDWLRRELPGFITRDDDAALFPDLIGESGAVPLPDKT